MDRPCDQCPWRAGNQRKPHPYGFYTMKNLRRLWQGLRTGGGTQSCHLTDPRHPDHLAAGCKPGAKPKECPGAVILVLRELSKMADKEGLVGDPMPYLNANRGRGLTRQGVIYWGVNRIMIAGRPSLGGGARLPDVDINDPAIELPNALRSVAPSDAAELEGKEC